MGFGGSVAAMMQSLKQNKAQLKSNKSYFDKNANYGNAYGAFVDHKKMTPEQFVAFKNKIKQEKKREQKRMLLSMSVLILLLVGLLSYFLFT